MTLLLKIARCILTWLRRFLRFNHVMSVTTALIVNLQVQVIPTYVLEQSEGVHQPNLNSNTNAIFIPIGSCTRRLQSTTTIVAFSGSDPGSVLMCDTWVAQIWQDLRSVISTHFCISSGYAPVSGDNLVEGILSVSENRVGHLSSSYLDSLSLDRRAATSSAS